MEVSILDYSIWSTVIPGKEIPKIPIFIHFRIQNKMSKNSNYKKFAFCKLFLRIVSLAYNGESLALFILSTVVVGKYLFWVVVGKYLFWVVVGKYLFWVVVGKYLFRVVGVSIYSE